MVRRTRSAVAVAVLGGALALAPAGVASAQSVVDPYSNGKVSPNTLTPPTVVKPASQNRTSPSTLPFTGGEIVMITAAGLGALAVGTVLVGAGRRRAAPVRSR